MRSSLQKEEIISRLRELQRLLPQCLLTDHIELGLRIERALEHLRRGERAPLHWDRWLARAKASIALRERRARLAERVSYPPHLPITEKRAQIVQAIRDHRAVVIAGDTGSGKSTQIPKMCLEAGRGQRGRIGMTQPRRVAALSISRRLAEELGVEWGRQVGCKIRFADHTHPESTIKVMTDGMLLAEVRSDPFLTEYDTIIVDEAHERSINIDFLLGHLRNLLRQRDDLKVIITSATIDTELFARAFDAPVIEVSGRLYPIEVRYRPFDSEREDLTYVEAAVEATLELLTEAPAGDVLVFMPTERDIRETCELLQKRTDGSVEILPLFGRLSAADQQRIFHPGPRRRVIVATNVAETSITVPRIRYVVDTGLARISRYHPGTRSQRLPIEPISQSSADQRMGRCGRLEGGVCIRLYSQEDYESRPRYTEPEIRRANLADVLLRLKAYGLGDIETFPFLEPPPPEAIRGAYQLLEELGALDAEHRLTEIGRQLAQLPVDPTIGRMILQAQREGALREVLIIAAGLSIQDPREYPFERLQEARQAHARFDHPRSDFLTLLNLWNAFHQTWETFQTQSQLRKFCRRHFLSYPRMREWVDLHSQLVETLHEIGAARFNERPASEEAIHRSILTGLLSHVAKRLDRNLYQTTGNRKITLYPGSTLFRQSKSPKARSQGKEPEEPEARPPQPDWIVAGEIVETSQRFARTVAGIRPEWILELAGHLCRASYVDPDWVPEAERVLVTERIHFRGLLLRERRVPYARIHPQRAKEIFVRKALVEERCPRRYEFLEHNRRLRERLEYWLSRLPHRRGLDLDEAFYRFYMDRLPLLASSPDLDRFLRQPQNRELLHATVETLLGPEARSFDPSLYPESIQIGQESVPVQYRYAPGTDQDGVTLQLRAPLVELVDPQWLDWVVPALREERILAVLQQLPRSWQRRLGSLRELAARIVREVPFAGKETPHRIAEYLRRHYGLSLPPEAFLTQQLPDHLRVRLEVVDESGKPIAAGRDLASIQEQVRRRALTEQQEAWRKAAARWERYDLQDWTIGDVPDRYLVTELSGLPVYGYPGLHVEDGRIHLRLFPRLQDAQVSTQRTFPVLAQRALHKELAWYHKELSKDLRRYAGPLYAPLGPVDHLLEDAWGHLMAYVFPVPSQPPPLRAAVFRTYVAEARQRLREAPARLVRLVCEILQQRHRLWSYPKSYPGMQAEINALVPPRFLRFVSFLRLPHLLRYLRAIQIRADRAAVNPAKDREKAQRVLPFIQALRQLMPQAQGNPQRAAQLQRFRWLIEEFKVLVFAQELGTAEKVSEKRLHEFLRQLRSQWKS